MKLARRRCPTLLIRSVNVHHCVCVGQKRVVNVYRLITRGTLEEKIMGLQKFKMSIANTVISQDNASLQSMGTDQLLNLFSLDKVRACQRVFVMETLRNMLVGITDLPRGDTIL